MFHFTALEKLWVFFLKPDLISKLHLLKPNCVVICHDINNVGNSGYCEQKVKVTYSGLKMSEIIITEATLFFYLDFVSRTFTIHRTSGYLFNFS